MKMILTPASTFVLFLFFFDSTMAHVFSTPGDNTSLIRNTLESKSVMNPKGETWAIDDTSVDDLPIPLGMHTSTQLNTNRKSMIYIIGGCTGVFRYIEDSINDGTAKKWPWKCTDFSKKVFAFNPHTDSYRVLADMPIGKYGHTAVIVDGKIWVIGGRSRQLTIQSNGNTVYHDRVDRQIDVYDIAENSWDTIKNFKKATASGASFSLESGSLYYAGGYDNAYIATNEVVKIDTRKYIDEGLFEFESVASLKVARGMIHATTVNRVGFIAGGSFEGQYCEALTSVEEYNPYAEIRGSKFKGTDVGYNDVWSLIQEMTDLSKDVHPSALINLNDQIIAFTGVQNDKCSQDLEQSTDVLALDWKDANSKWYAHGIIPESRFYFSAVPMPERYAALIFGGTTFYENECNCMETMTRVSAYYTQDSEPTLKQGKTMSGVAILAISLWITVAFLVLIGFFIKRKSEPPETVVNQEGVSSLPGVNGMVEGANKDLGLVKNGKENEREVL